MSEKDYENEVNDEKISEFQSENSEEKILDTGDSESYESLEENVINEKQEEPETPEVKVIKLELELQEWKDAYTRKLAEFQNFTKRKEAEVNEMKKYASEEIIIKLLDNIDNLERAEAASIETKNFDALVEGVNMILRNLKNLLNEEGVEEIETEGKEFNPYEHQAMMTESKEEFENDAIVQTFQKGYKLKGKVIRPAMVTVNKK
ncbi:nucleotide exchange factor GrpE [Leptotrichia sp. OH3620_COT-345]|uniref:nucleotide exchange factor GrpE n=1 Tax=Leptotrichia sp. OH3620_COT-345 TaxID=2491048 RepID=UPI000F64BA23|nr:nucleotide exchange factor GrpE [Leptotrichia sp. OH3620_COT-345]RRD40259.1 nucleotide exchange factor GrpE [Leptotrichia sp. OH3620_COT-345]